MKRGYEEFKVRNNALVANAQKIPKQGWTMQDGTAEPGNSPRDHTPMIQFLLPFIGVLRCSLGIVGGLDTDGNELPRLVYVSREKCPGFQHHKKVGAMNALVLTISTNPERYDGWFRPIDSDDCGYDEEESVLTSQKGLEKLFGQSAVFIAVIFMEQGSIPPTANLATLLKQSMLLAVDMRPSLNGAKR
ncbi:hypothetical protein RHGRI_005518 [Rhododendron griersonianum]|uniref:Uncharacterized protein n=1 Tax=Rhododendron griersonianum TaxID=479676 RepID=A0AAV6LDK7_9ERIC|nr:hypothetical protein RHGRI_005518 [Rhododendron griersonianum]